MEPHAKYPCFLIKLSADIPNTDDMPLSAVVLRNILLYIMDYPDCICRRYMAIRQAISNHRNLYAEPDTRLTRFMDGHFTNGGCIRWYGSDGTLVYEYDGMAGQMALAYPADNQSY